MAPTFVFSIAGQLLGKLSSPIIEELSLAWGLTDDLRRLKNTVSSVRAVLLDAQEQQSNNHQLKHWLEELEDALYHAEDVLEEFEIHALRYKSSNKSILTKVRRAFSRSNRFVFRLEMAHKIKKIREEFDEIASNKDKFNLLPGTNERVVTIRKMTHSFIRDEDVIGREDEKQAVIRFLNATSDGERLSVLPIVGIGGMGKTTLAQSVFNDKRVQTQFDLKIWVCISEDFELKNVIKEILKSANFPDCDNLSLEQLQQRLREKLKDQKYLLILDDVWNEDRVKWVDLKDLLMGDASGSKIVVTTRNQSVASIVATTDPIWIQGLPHPQCSSLFLKWAFGSSQEASRYPRLNKIAEEIVEKCKGVPLAIRTLGSLLYLKREESEWIHVRDNDIWKIDQKEDDIMPVLKFSYYQLPNNLRRCFAFCSIFPKDYEFSSNELIQMWQANGMLQQSDGNQDLEDVGLMYAKQLFSRGFFQEWTDWQSVANFKMHDLVHDLALLVAERDCINLTSQNSQDIFPKRVVRVVRHISFPKDYFKARRIPNWLLEQKKNVHTIAFPNGMGDCEASFLRTCISEFKSLRFLDRSQSSFQELPVSIGHLKHLKYLDLSFNDQLKLLPPSLCELVGLDTLLFGGCSNIEKMPRGIGKLIRLRTLSIATKEPYLPEDEIRCLTSLKTLVIRDCRNLEFLVSDDAMQCLSALCTLWIYDCPSLKRLPTRGLRQLTRLETIDISGCENLNLMSGDDSDNSGATSSEGGEGLRNLHSLCLSGLPKLEILPPWLLHGANNLKYIYIGTCPYLTKLIPEGMGESLKSLHTLFISSCPNLTKLIPEGMEESLKSLHTLEIYGCENLTKLIPEGMEESLKSLHTLTIHDCPELVSLPEGMHRLTALGKIVIRDCPELSRRCKRESGEDWHKISHVPEIILDGRKM